MGRGSLFVPTFFFTYTEKYYFDFQSSFYIARYPNKALLLFEERYLEKPLITTKSTLCCGLLCRCIGDTHLKPCVYGLPMQLDVCANSNLLVFSQRFPIVPIDRHSAEISRYGSLIIGRNRKRNATTRVVILL